MLEMGWRLVENDEFLILPTGTSVTMKDVREIDDARRALRKLEDEEMKRRIAARNRARQDPEKARLLAQMEADKGAFYLTLVPIRPRSRGERRSLRTFPGASLRPSLAFNPRPRRHSTPLLTHFNSTPTFARMDPRPKAERAAKGPVTAGSVAVPRGEGRMMTAEQAGASGSSGGGG
jgi:hypothetical protein